MTYPGPGSQLTLAFSSKRESHAPCCDPDTCRTPLHTTCVYRRDDTASATSPFRLRSTAGCELPDPAAAQRLRRASAERTNSSITNAYLKPSYRINSAYSYSISSYDTSATVSLRRLRPARYAFLVRLPVYGSAGRYNGPVVSKRLIRTQQVAVVHP